MISLPNDLRDTEQLRYFSMVPDDHREEAFCVRHQRRMAALDPVLTRHGTTYRVAPAYTAFTCPDCLAEISAASDLEDAGPMAYRAAITGALDCWLDGEAAADWFVHAPDATREQAEGCA